MQNVYLEANEIKYRVKDFNECLNRILNGALLRDRSDTANLIDQLIRTKDKLVEISNAIEKKVL